MQLIFALVAKRLNIKEHYAGRKQTSESIFTPVDLEVHRGTVRPFVT